ncbi:MAG: hypothetical protein AAGI14_06285 [Pseudomonadota bacterium]
MKRHWRESHLMMEHALKTLAAFDTGRIASDPSSFEATEFPLLVEDLQHSLSALKASCIQMERALIREDQRAEVDIPLPKLRNG